MMAELSRADVIWNRACARDATASSQGDRALAALLLLHGLVMNGGVLHAVKCLTPQELACAMSGYRYFGFDDVAVMLADAKSFVEAHDDLYSHDDIESIDADLDKRYLASIPSDNTLFARFAACLLRDPSQFAPLSRPSQGFNILKSI
jgi:hypothetical protein